VTRADWRDAWRAAFADLRRRATHPPIVTAAAVASVLVTAARFHTFTHDLPLDVGFRYGYSGRALSMGRWSTVLTSQFLSRDSFMAISIALSLILMLGLYEAIAGSVRALVVAFVTGAAGPIFVAGALGLGSALGNGFAGRTLSTLDYGMSAVTAGAGGALVAVIGNRRLRILAILWVLGGLLVHHQIADWEHLSAFTVGLGLGYLLGAPGERRVSLRRPLRLAGAGVAVVVGSTAGALAAGAAVPAPALFVPVVTAPALPSGFHGAKAGAPSTTTSRAAPESAPSVVGVSYPSPALGGNRSAFVVLPPGYDRGARRYPVVELLHGYPGAPGDIVSGLDPVAAEELPGMPPFIGVAPDGRGPAYADSWFADTPRQKVGTAVSNDLVAFVAHHFRTNGHWSVAGLSAGGYGAAYLAESHPGRYDAVCALSGVFVADTGAFASDSRAQRLAASPMSHVSATGPRTLLIAGSSDATSLRESNEYAALMAPVGEPHQVLVRPGGHEWNLWRAELPTCLRYVLATPPPAPVR
jgi:enterochelin esterase-like enzyme